MGNIVVPVKRLHYSLQYLSELSYFKLTNDIMMTAIYGFDRCLQNELSVVLYELEISEKMFWRKIFYFILICISFKLFTLLLLIFKISYQFKDNRKSIDRHLTIRLSKVTF